MKYRVLVIMLVTLGFLTHSSLLGQENEGMPPEMARYFVGLIYKDINWSPEATPEVMEIQKAHLENIEKLVDNGKMVLAGPFGDDGDLRGLFFYKAESIEEAEELVSTDPAVKAGRLRVELHPWWGPKALENLIGDHTDK